MAGKQRLCECGCGNLTSQRKQTASRLGYKKGDYARFIKGHNHLSNFIDIKGERFGRLVVLKKTSKRTKYNKAVWLCRCDCGNTKEVVSSNLKTKTTMSCGCLQGEVRKELSYKLRKLPVEAYEIERQKRQVEYLTDGYIRSLLRDRGFNKEDITQKLMDTQRSKVIIHRAVAKTKEVLNELL